MPKQNTKEKREAKHARRMHRKANLAAVVGPAPLRRAEPVALSHDAARGAR